MSTGSIGTIRTKKAVIRLELLGRRHALSQQECAQRSKIICERFLAVDQYRDASTILLYKAYNNEVDTDLIFERAIEDGKTVAYPLSSINDGEPDLKFYVINDLSDLKAGYKGIKEPDLSKDPVAFDEKADICIVPGVGFDRKCHRIGYGKAFYDRYIRLNGPKLVAGLAYDLQITDDFEPEETDRSVDIVVTESATYTGSGS